MRKRTEIHSTIVISIYGLVLLLGFEFDFHGFFISFLFSGSGRKNNDVSDETVQLIFGDCLLISSVVQPSTYHRNITWQQRTMRTVVLGLR